MAYFRHNHLKKKESTLKIVYALFSAHTNTLRSAIADQTPSLYDTTKFAYGVRINPVLTPWYPLHDLREVRELYV